MRRFCLANAKSASSSLSAHQQILMASLMFNSSLSKEARDAITKGLSRVKDEAKGQLLDLTDMNEASRNAGNALQEVIKRNAIEDAKIKGKIATLTASLKAYNTRLSNLTSEARAVQNEADSLIKLLWGNTAGANAAPADAKPVSVPADADNGDFGVEVPPLAKKVEEILGEKVSSSSLSVESAAASSSSASSSSSAKVETLEGDFIREDLTAPKKSSSTASSSNGSDEDLEIELEVEPTGSSASSSSSSSASSTPAQSANQILAEKASIPEITSELHNAGVDFSACRDADSLRKKYLDFLDGKHKKPTPTPKANSNSSQRVTQQPPTPRPPQQQQYQQQYQQPPPNTSETGVANDPYPGGVRKMVDPMKTVWEVKMEIAKERNVDANTINLWSGKTCLEDHKRLYDYPTIQQFPIEVRQKGDNPY